MAFHSQSIATVLQLNDHPSFMGGSWLHIIFDIDGTLLDISQRLKFIKTKPKDWEAFRDPIQKRWDEPRLEIISILVALHQAGHTIILASGRVESEREATLSTLRQHISFVDDLPFFLRKDGDYRKDTILKESMLFKMKQKGYHPVIAFDDRPSVVRMWRANNLVVADVGPGKEF
jgi:acid phosphatase class B